MHIILQFMFYKIRVLTRSKLTLERKVKFILVQYHYKIPSFLDYCGGGGGE